MRRVLLTFGAAALLSGCAGSGDGAPSAASFGAPAAATAAAGAPMDTAAYAAEAGRIDLYEIRSSELAATQASSPAVKSFAAQMVRDHTASTRMMTSAVGQTGMIAAPPTLDPRRQALVDQLKAAQGADFDRLYVQQQKQAHQEALALHQAYAKDGKAPELRTVAQQIVPVVQHHAEMLQSM